MLGWRGVLSLPRKDGIELKKVLMRGSLKKWPPRHDDCGRDWKTD